MKKAEMEKLLGEWLDAIEYAEGLLAREKAKPRDSYDHWRPEGGAWVGLTGWLGMIEHPSSPGIVARTRAALGRESGDSIPAAAAADGPNSRESVGRGRPDIPDLNKTGGSVTWEETGDTIAPCCFLFPMETPPGGVWTCPECGASWRRDQDQCETMGTVRRLEGAALALALNKTGGSHVHRAVPGPGTSSGRELCEECGEWFSNL